MTKRSALWEDAARVAAGAAWATADTLHAAAAVLGSRVLRQAADSYDRTARAQYGRVPWPAQTGNDLRRVARLLSAVYISGDPALAQMTLAGRFARLVEAGPDLRNAQQRAAQAAAARQAAEHLYAAMPGHAGPAARRRVTTRTAAERNRIEFPFPPGMVPPTEPLPDAYRSSQSGSGPSYNPGTPSRRGPGH